MSQRQGAQTRSLRGHRFDSNALEGSSRSLHFVDGVCAANCDIDAKRGASSRFQPPPDMKAPTAILAFLAFACITSHAAAGKPTVVLFLVDDMGWMDCGVYGSKYYETPRMDAFAKTAMRFTSAYAQPLCSPTRASLLSGQYDSRHGI